MFSLRLAAVSASLLLTIACGSSPSPSPAAPSPAPAPAPAPTPAPAPPGSSVTIPVGAATLGNRAFAPPDLNITTGTTVTWMNTDAVTHTSTSDAAGWNSGNIAPGAQFSVAFPNSGTFPYHCAIHPGMVGNVVVR